MLQQLLVARCGLLRQLADGRSSKVYPAALSKCMWAAGLFCAEQLLCVGMRVGACGRLGVGYFFFRCGAASLHSLSLGGGWWRQGDQCIAASCLSVLIRLFRVDGFIETLNLFRVQLNPEP
jgi:hypothetical protein